MNNRKAQYPRPLPVLEEWNAPFFSAGESNRILLQVCNHCEKTVYYCRPFCPYCGGTDLLWKEQPVRGKIFSWSTIWRAENPYFNGEIPFHIALVELTNGVKLFTRIKVRNGGHPEIDAPVEAYFEQVGEGVWLPYFEMLGRQGV